MLQKRLLDAGVIWSGRWASIVLAFPKADGTFIDIERRREVLLCHTGKSPRRAQLPTGDEIITPIGHGRLVIFHVTRGSAGFETVRLVLDRLDIGRELRVGFGRRTHHAGRFRFQTIFRLPLPPPPQYGPEEGSGMEGALFSTVGSGQRSGQHPSNFDGRQYVARYEPLLRHWTNGRATIAELVHRKKIYEELHPETKH